MKLAMITIISLVSFGAAASTDAELCQQYGKDIASNVQEGQATFLTEMTARTEAGTWGLSMQECNRYIQQAKRDQNFEIADLLNDE